MIGAPAQTAANFINQLLSQDYKINDYNLISQDKYLRFVKNNPNNKGNANFIAAFTTREKNSYLTEEQSVEFRLEYNNPKDIHFEASPYSLSRNTHLMSGLSETVQPARTIKIMAYFST